MTNDMNSVPLRNRPVVGDVRSLRGLAILVQALLVAWIPFGIAAFAANLSQRSLLHRIVEDPVGVRWSEVLADRDRVDLLNQVFLGLLALTAIAFIAWFAVAYSNLDAFGVDRGYSTGWAVYGWLVPFLCWWRPKQLADEIWQTVDVANGGRPERQPRSPLVWSWWAAWVACTVVALFATRGSSDDATTIDEALTSNLWYSVRAVFFVVAAVLAIFVVRTITRAQRLDVGSRAIES
ncbi:MAG: DUF4328 domain-containing protein [Acidimicrobiia bacterium]